jgi:DNA-binding transcriptional MocR family regulator
MEDPGRKLIATNSLSTLLAASDKKVTKNPKTRKIRKLLEQEGDKNHATEMNEKADSAAKKALDEQIDRTEEYPPQDKMDYPQLEENQQTHWEQNGTEMRNRKPHTTNSIDTSAMKRREQVVISRLRTGYTRAEVGKISLNK